MPPSSRPTDERSPCGGAPTSVLVPDPDPRLHHRLLAGPGDLTPGRSAGLPVRPRPAALRQPDRVEGRCRYPAPGGGRLEPDQIEAMNAAERRVTETLLLQMERVASLPGVEAVALTSVMPFGGVNGSRSNHRGRPAAPSDPREQTERIDPNERPPRSVAPSQVAATLGSASDISVLPVNEKLPGPGDDPEGALSAPSDHPEGRFPPRLEPSVPPPDMRTSPSNEEIWGWTLATGGVWKAGARTSVQPRILVLIARTLR